MSATAKVCRNSSQTKFYSLQEAGATAHCSTYIKYSVKEAFIIASTTWRLHNGTCNSKYIKYN